MSNISDIVKKNITELTTEDIQTLLDFANLCLDNIPSYYSFENILKRELADVDDSLDKRVGSIVYDGLYPAAGEMAQLYIAIQIYKEQTYIKTAVGDNLDKIGENYSIPREQATQALRIGEFIDTNDNYINLPIGSRFSVPDSDSTITYVITKWIETGKAILQCEQAGTIGNEYVGAILPLFSINNLKEATIIGTQTPAQDVEDDDTYRDRIIRHLNSKGFGGNIQDYKDYIEKIDGTSEPRVYPVWNGGGTVKVSVLDSQYNAISSEFQDEIKELIDPVEYTGLGVGMAPIGHNVTIDTPTEVEINISATLDLDTVTIGQVQAQIEANLENYLLSIRKEWAKKDYLSENDYTSVYIAQVIANMVNVNGVKNATDILINEENSDLNIENTALEQFVPVLGTVELIENE